MIVDDMGLLRSSSRPELPIVVPNSIVLDVLKFVHGSRLTGHYKLRRTMAKLWNRYWWKSMARDAAKFVLDCIQCTVVEDRQPGKQTFLEIVHPKRRLQLVAFDIQTITPRTKSGNLKVLAMIDVMTRFVRA